MSNKELAAADPAAKIAFKNANKHFTEGNKHAEKAVACYLKVGDCLNLARSYFPGDKEFGQYRAQAMPNISPKWASDLMRIAARFEVEKLPDMKISVLKEIATASDETVQHVLERAETDEPVTVKEAREMVRVEREVDDTSSPPTDDTSPASEPVEGTHIPASASAPSRAPDEPRPDTKSLEQKEAELLGLEVGDRLAAAENFWHYIGVSMYFDNPPAHDTCYQLKSYFCTKYPDYRGRIEAAYIRDAQ